MLRFKYRRAGLSLMEALVALFIMAIGMISLLTLFPLGAIQMGRALRDDRCAQCAWQGDGVVRTWWQTEVVDLPGAETGPYFTPLENGATTGPSNVVAIDPIGIYSGYPTKIAGTISRQNATQPTSLKKAIRACTMLDDLFFDETGSADNQSAVTVDIITGKKQIVRQGRYNWMALVQRPVNRNRNTANLKILVFDGRAPGTFPVNAETQLNTTTTTPTISGGGSQVIVNMSLTNPAFPLIGKGGWIMDPGSGDRMDFYRVQSMTDNGAATTLELDTPLKNTVTNIVIFRGLAEVFDRPMLMPGGIQTPPTP